MSYKLRAVLDKLREREREGTEIKFSRQILVWFHDTIFRGYPSYTFRCETYEQRRPSNYMFIIRSCAKNG
jgi:hypothetical protein